MDEKRRFKRLDVDLPVTLRFAGRLIPATTLNISCGGACLNLESDNIDLSDNNNVEVIIDISQKDRDISIRGEITRIEDGERSRLGVKFTNLYTVGHQTLEEFINKNLN